MTAPAPTLTAAQVDLLMQDLHASRVLSLDGNSYLAQWDVRAMLTRVFGFGGWSMELSEPSRLLYEQEVTLKNGKPGFKTAYVAQVRLVVCTEDGQPLATYEASGVGEHNMPDFKRGDCHDNAIKTAESAALKRAAINLGTQFGLGLYGNTQREVIRVLAVDPRKAGAGRPAFTNPDAAAADPVPVEHDDDLIKPEDGTDG
jgi:recombination DNA repair RAD52 pathway protein